MTFTYISDVTNTVFGAFFWVLNSKKISSATLHLYCLVYFNDHKPDILFPSVVASLLHSNCKAVLSLVEKLVVGMTEESHMDLSL